MTDLTTRAREMCEGGKVDPQIVVMVYELCDALEKAESEIVRLKNEVIKSTIVNAIAIRQAYREVNRAALYNAKKQQSSDMNPEYKEDNND